jgi:hypothetical protein
MEETEWEEYVKKYNYKVRPNQYPFYKRTLDFLKDKNEQILVNQGGMGLGKTFAASAAINETKTLFSGAFIGTPTGAIKNEWVKELKKFNLFNHGVVWYAKSDLCIKKIADKHFGIKSHNGKSRD